MFVALRFVLFAFTAVCQFRTARLSAWSLRPIGHQRIRRFLRSEFTMSFLSRSGGAASCLIDGLSFSIIGLLPFSITYAGRRRSSRYTACKFLKHTAMRPASLLSLYSTAHRSWPGDTHRRVANDRDRIHNCECVQLQVPPVPSSCGQVP